MTAEVLPGPAGWRMVLSAAVSRLTLAALLWVNRAAGLVILAFDLAEVMRGIKY